MAKILDKSGGTLSVVGAKPKFAVKLTTGLSIWKGHIDEEYLSDLKPWHKAYKVFRQMKDDAVIGTLFESVAVPLLDAKFEIVPASQDDGDLKAAEWLDKQLLSNPKINWLGHVDEMLDFMAYGFSLTEKVLERDKEGRLGLADLMPISQETLWRWGDPDKHGKITHFMQYDPTTNINPSVTRGRPFRFAPMDKLLHFAYRQRKRNPMGNPICRSLYRAWYFRSNLEVIESIGAERDIGNVPVAELGEGVYTQEDIDHIQEALEGLRIDETASMIVPNGTQVKPFGSGSKTYDLRSIIRDYNHTIRQRFFMDFVSLGSEGVGTQALAKEVTGFFSLALGSIQQQMIEAWNKQLIEWIFKYNAFPNITALPVLKWSKPGKINIQSLAGTISTLLASEAIHRSKPLEDHLREALELPEISDEEIAAEEQKALEQQQLGAQAQGGGPQSEGNQQRQRKQPGEITGGDQKNKVS